MQDEAKIELKNLHLLMDTNKLTLNSTNQMLC